MKIKTDFVTNSSSTCFVCSICGEAEGGRDLSLSDVEMYECVEGHTFCESHVNREAMIKYLKKELNEELESADKSETQDIVENLANLEAGYVNSVIDEGDYRYEMPEEICPICSLHYVEDESLIKYLLKKQNLSKVFLIKQIKGRFNSLKDLKKHLKEK